METKAILVFQAFLILMVAPAISGNLFLWWSGYFSNFWSGLFHQLISSAVPGSQPTVQQEFANRLSSLQNKTGVFSSFYLSNAEQYAKQFGKVSHFNLNQSLSIQITDRNTTTSPVIGNLTVTWIGTSRTLTITRGIVSSGVSPTYYVTANHKAFMALSNDAINFDALSGFADYLSFNSTGAIRYGWQR
jgi:hypothetical protein